MVLRFESTTIPRINHLLREDSATSSINQRAGWELIGDRASPARCPAAPVGVGVIGYGYWGPNLVRNFAAASGSEVLAVSDLSTERLAAARARYPSTATTTDVSTLLSDPAIEAVAISTPVATHFPLAIKALRAGKHVFVEKPLTTTVQQADLLIEEAERNDRVLMVDHTFVYTGAVQKIKELVDSGRLGRLRYYDSVRVNLGLFQHDVDVLWDLAVHDLAIMDFVLGRQPYAVAATGAAHVPGKPINIGYLTCFFEDNLLAHVNANWLAPVKVRRTLVGGDQQMVVYDDLEPSEKLKVYDRGITLRDSEESTEGIHELLVSYRTGDMWAPRVSLKEALSVETSHFVECIRNSTQPLTSGLAGRRVVKILEAASRSLAEGGRPIELQIESLAA